jgi:hypothetical protein
MTGVDEHPVRPDSDWMPLATTVARATDEPGDDGVTANAFGSQRAARCVVKATTPSFSTPKAVRAASPRTLVTDAVLMMDPVPAASM